MSIIYETDENGTVVPEAEVANSSTVWSVALTAVVKVHVAVPKVAIIDELLTDPAWVTLPELVRFTKMYVCHDLTPKVVFLRAIVKDLINDTQLAGTGVTYGTPPLVAASASFLKTYATLVAGIEDRGINLNCVVPAVRLGVPAFIPKPAYI